VKTQHSGAGKASSCELPGCGFTASNASELKAHIATHPQETISCDVTGCNYTTKDSERFVNHKRVAHKGERPYICEHPGCSFSTVRKQQSFVFCPPVPACGRARRAGWC
jgi:hypothetical protein